jgi:hypothetical protein
VWRATHGGGGDGGAPSGGSPGSGAPGGGAPGGQVIGATDRLGHSASERVLSPENFVSTVYTKLGIDPSKSFLTPAGRPTFLVSDPTPIRELF